MMTSFTRLLIVINWCVLVTLAQSDSTAWTYDSTTGELTTAYGSYNPTSAMINTTMTATTTTTTAVPVSSLTCGATVGCFIDEDGNSVKYQMTADGSEVRFDIECVDVGWCVLAFSNRRRMPSSSAIDCMRHPITGEITVQHSYNDATYYNIDVENATSFLRVISTSYNMGVLKCSLYRQIVVTGNSKIYSLDTSWFLLLGRGTVDNQGKKMKHTTTPAMSASRVDVRLMEDAPLYGDCDLCMLRAHDLLKMLFIIPAFSIELVQRYNADDISDGCLMLSAWILLVSSSIILARYFKTAWPGDKICATAVWFACHRFMTVLALICTTAGFILAYVFEDRRSATYAAGDPIYWEWHAPLGITVMSLAIANPLMALIRCDPNSPHRPLFNWLHWLIGTTCHIIALITCAIGINMVELSRSKTIAEPAVFWLFVAFIVFHCVVEVFLTYHKVAVDAAIRKRKENVSKQNAYEVDSTETNIDHGLNKGTNDSSENVENGMTSTADLTTKTSEKPENVLKQAASLSHDLKVRYLVLATYFLVVLGLWMAMVIMIAT